MTKTRQEAKSFKHRNHIHKTLQMHPSDPILACRFPTSPSRKSFPLRIPKVTKFVFSPSPAYSPPSSSHSSSSPTHQSSSECPSAVLPSSPLSPVTVRSSLRALLRGFSSRPFNSYSFLASIPIRKTMKGQVLHMETWR